MEAEQLPAGFDNSTCLHGSLASHIARLTVCSLSTLLNVVVLLAVCRGSGQARGFVLLVAIDVLMSLCLSLRSAMAWLAITMFSSNRADHAHCQFLKWLTTAWKVAYLARSWWIVAITTVRYSVVAKPLSAAPIDFRVKRQAVLLGLLTSLATVITVSVDIVNSSVDYEHVWDVTIIVEVTLSSGVPIVAVMALTGGMTRCLIRRRRLWLNVPPDSDDNLRATKTLLLVSASFFVLSFPHFLYEIGLSVSSLLGFSYREMPYWLDILGEVKSLLISIDPSLNFAIYFSMCRQFRSQLLRFLHIRMPCLEPTRRASRVLQPQPERSAMLRQTRA